MRLNIACDDVNPLVGYRILGDKTEKWFRQLNEDYGVKFTLFIPSNYHNQAPLSQHKEWIQELASIEWLELAAHGHFHMTTDPKRFGECEFFELQNIDNIVDRLRMMFNEWNKVGIIPIGWRSPGWLMSTPVSSLVSTQFEYAAAHYEHNVGLNWGRTDFKVFFGHDGIQQEHISIHNGDMIMFQSHIAGNHNHNVWNEHNYNQLRSSLEYLYQNYVIDPKCLSEC